MNDVAGGTVKWLPGMNVFSGLKNDSSYVAIGPDGTEMPELAEKLGYGSSTFVASPDGKYWAWNELTELFVGFGPDYERVQVSGAGHIADFMAWVDLEP